ncbi:MAG: hypothetical protein M1816_006566 [Peltula sp. TS41687]|nr:MAG: hypothetical protein M1816_006566 [Peltula sp. TS41687]
MPTMAEHLPSPRTFLDSLFAQLPREDAPATNQPQDVPEPSCRLKALTGHDKRLFVTLHCLFPNDLLPALDLLDRQLVTRLVVSAQHPDGQQQHEDATSVYYVRSAQAPSRSRYQSGPSNHATTGQHYEVRLRAWNCSCPAFTFAAFGNISSDDDNVNISLLLEEGSDEAAAAAHPCGFGGLRRRLLGGEPVAVPMCKHLMACLLAEQCQGLLGGYVAKNTVSKEELAGWAAGWGE